MTEETQAIDVVQPTALTWLDRLSEPQKARLQILAAGERDAQEKLVARAVASLSLAMKQNPKLMQCEPGSVLMSVAACLSMGLEPHALPTPSRSAQAMLIPRGNQCNLQITATGWVTLLDRAGWSVTSQAVRDGDTFAPDFDTCKANHVMAMREAGLVCGAWARFEKGRRVHLEVLRYEDIADIRDTSDAWKRQGDSSPWGKWPGQMARKSAIVRGARHLGLDGAINEVAQMDNEGV